MRRLPLLALLPLLTAADWTHFRGDAAGSGTSAETSLPTGFTAEAGLRWKAALPGRGVSSPVIVGRHVYLTCSSGTRDDRLHIFCFDAMTGAEKWHRQLTATGSTAAHPDTCMAAPTPAADAGGVFALFATGDLGAFSPAGDLRWYRSIVEDYPAVTNQVGMAASPVLAGDKLVVPMDNAGESFLAALDPATGKNVWRTPRPKDMNWTTPVARAVGGKTQVLQLGQAELVAYDLDTGKKLWAAKAGGAIPTPSLVGDKLLVPASGATLLALTPTGAKEVWRSPKLNTNMASPVTDGKYVYGPTSGGFVTCADFATGKVVWQERIKGKFSASPVVGAGQLYLFAEDGMLTTLKLGDKPEVLAESKTDGRGQATPALAGGAVFLRTDKTLYCVGGK